MPAILELPEVRRRVAGLTVNAYESLVQRGLAPKRGELIHGVIIEKMSKSGLHVRLAKLLYDWLLRLAPPGTAVFQEGPLHLVDSVPEPDVMIVPNTLEELNDEIPTSALLVVKVALSSVAADREYASMYAKANVPEYWIVLAETKQIEVRRRPADGFYQDLRVYDRHEELSCESVPTVSVPLSRLFGP